jgi:hypothetical protein
VCAAPAAGPARRRLAVPGPGGDRWIGGRGAQARLAELADALDLGTWEQA